MSLERPEDFYGSDEMSAAECLALAGEYMRAAMHLKTIWRPRKAASRAPFRFTAIHAIELYLTAYLLHAGEPWPKLRRMGHNLQQRHDVAADRGLMLRKRTRTSLGVISRQREYLKSRYAQNEARPTQLNRLEATLEEVAKKVAAAFVG
jgi:hypothetical protein